MDGLWAYFRNQTVQVGLCLLVILLAGGACIYTIRWSSPNHKIQAFIAEMHSLEAHGASLDDEVTLYKNFLQEVPPETAQDSLLSAFPNLDGRAHLVDHETGIFLYQTYGASGIAHCENLFLGGCYHGFVIAMMTDLGIGAKDEILTACNSEMKNNINGCAHALGHALLVSVGYQHLTDAITQCQDSFPNNTITTVSCFSGVFMQNTIGVGDSAGGEGHLYKADDPLYPCNDPKIAGDPAAYQLCWTSQSNSILDAQAYPSIDGNIQKANAYCEDMKSTADTTICFKGIARGVMEESQQNLDAMRHYCSQLGPARAPSCIWDAAATAYRFGADPTIVEKACAAETEESLREQCYHEAYLQIGLKYSDTTDRLKACDTVVDNAHKTACEELMRGSIDSDIVEEI